ncbi:MAG: hypothetical protein FJW27_01700 [Acidimicrobiia bacterium]|nr:hypothetical protein [Acidimicrobiia bacterium]
MRLDRIGGGLVLAVLTALTPLAGQTQPPATTSARSGPAAPDEAAKAVDKNWKMPKTPWGHPDIQGIWNNGTTTPLERPADLADREFLSKEEWATRAKESANRATNRPDDPDNDLALAYDNEWWDRGTPLLRTSLIVDPPNGKLPALTPEGKKVVDERAAARAKRGYADSYTDRPLQERCLLYHGVPPFPTGYNNNYQIVQTPTHVAIRYEMLAETRMIPLDGRPHFGPKVPQWMGNSRGRWEGDTLVVETTDYNDKATFRFHADHRSLKVIERFTRTSADAIDYKFTVENPTMYTSSFTAILPLVKSEGPIYEYACHEGNIGLANVLRGHRYEERQAKSGKAPRKRTN